MKRLIIAVLTSGVWLSIGASSDKPPVPAASIPAEWVSKVTDAARLPVEQNECGTLQWLCNSKLMPGARQTVGLAMILPGKSNPLHYHPNCEEVLYVLSGQGLQTCDGHTITLKEGMTIRIPAKVRHNLVNTGAEPLRTLVSFSSGRRKTVWIGKERGK